MIARMLIGASLLATGGCVTVAPAEGDIPVRGGGACDASRASALVGRPATSELAAEAMRLTGANAARWLQPGQIVTMEYREGRLNIKLDAQNRVTGFSCG